MRFHILLFTAFAAAAPSAFLDRFWKHVFTDVDQPGQAQAHVAQNQTAHSVEGKHGKHGKHADHADHAERADDSEHDDEVETVYSLLPRGLCVRRRHGRVRFGMCDSD